MPYSLVVFLPDRKACNAKVICDIANHQGDKAGIGCERNKKREPDEDRRFSCGCLYYRGPIKGKERLSRSQKER